METVSNLQMAQIAVQLSADWTRSKNGNFWKMVEGGNLSVAYKADKGWSWNMYYPNSKPVMPRFQGAYEFAGEAVFECQKWYEAQMTEDF